MTEKLALYFGCLGEMGHFLHAPSGQRRMFLDPEKAAFGIPWNIGHMDGGLLENGQEPDRPTGRVRWTLGGRPDLWFAFYWWDRSIDERGASNSGFYVRGFEIGQEQEAFEFACAQWPDVVKRQAHPLRLASDPPLAKNGGL